LSASSVTVARPGVSAQHAANDVIQGVPVGLLVPHHGAPLALQIRTCENGEAPMMWRLPQHPQMCGQKLSLPLVLHPRGMRQGLTALYDLHAQLAEYPDFQMPAGMSPGAPPALIQGMGTKARSRLAPPALSICRPGTAVTGGSKPSSIANAACVKRTARRHIADPQRNRSSRSHRFPRHPRWRCHLWAPVCDRKAKSPHWGRHR